jgi:HEAT repeat protein
MKRVTNVRVGIWDVIQRVAQVVVAGDVADMWRVEGETGALLGRLDTREWLEFGDHARSIYQGWYGGSGAWSRVRVSHVNALRHCESIPVTLAGVLSFHGDGYIRHAAVRVLDDVGCGAELRYLLVRLNDWVPAIRTAALAAVERRLHAGYVEKLALQVGLVVRLLTWRRTDHSQLLASIVALLGRPGVRPPLFRALDGASPSDRRLLYRLLLTRDESGRALLSRALSDPHPSCRLEAARRLSHDPELLQVALRDSFAGVRLLAARMLAPGPALLMDPASTVRALARYRLGGTDFATFYRQHLEAREPGRVVTALWGIAEVGDVASLPRVLGLMTDANPRVAAAAVRTLGVLGDDSRVTELLDALRRPELAVVRAAALSLFPRRACLDQAELWELSLGLTSVIARRRALNLLFHGPKWSAVLYILLSLADPEPKITSRARVALERWLRRFNHVGTPLAAGQLPRLRAALEAVREQLPADTARELEFSLR